MKDLILRQNFLKIVLSLGMVVLLTFSIYYWSIGWWQMAALEIVGVFMLLVAFVGVRLGNYLWPAILGWTGIFGIMVMLLLTGGISGTGIIWWGMMPVIGFVMFGVIGGLICMGVILLTFILVWISSMLGIYEFFYSTVYLRQTLMMLMVEGVIVYYFEQTATETRRAVELQAEELARENELRKQAQSDLQVKIDELNKQKSKQDQIRTAMINLLEDEKELEEELKKEKKNVERQVSARTSELRAVIDSINRGLIVVDRNRNIVLKNKVIDTMIVDKPNCTYGDIVEFLGTQIDVEEMVKQGFDQKKDISSGSELYDTRYLHVHTVPVLQNEQVFSVAIFVKDVTEALALARSRDEFFSIASHELRTPLTAIMGNTALIKEYNKKELENPELKEMIDDIHESSERLITIVNDFLNVSRLEMKKIEFKIENVDLAKLAQDTIDEFVAGGSLGGNQIELKMKKKEQYSAMADSDRLKQVLINLVANAIKFTKKGTITIELQREEEKILLYVKDNGSGIPKDQQSLLFHKFQQAGSSLYTRDTTKGTGLGLYISKLLMTGMKGDIWLESSTKGKGSVFAISLPAVV